MEKQHLHAEDQRSAYSSTTTLNTPGQSELTLAASTDSPRAPDGDSKPLKDEPAGIEGSRLFMVIAGVTLVCFVMLLDTSIISTVCLTSVHHFCATLLTLAGDP